MFSEEIATMRRLGFRHVSCAPLSEPSRRSSAAADPAYSTGAAPNPGAGVCERDIVCVDDVEGAGRCAQHAESYRGRLEVSDRSGPAETQAEARLNTVG